MPYGEILTLQAGHFANLVGASFWRSPETRDLLSVRRSDGSPRAVLFDSRDSLDGVRDDSSLYASDAPPVSHPAAPQSSAPAGDLASWHGEVTHIQRDGVSGPSWRDVRFHDRSSVSLPSAPPTFAAGRAAYAECVEVWEDRLRYFAEECDALQGFHLIVTPEDGFGGLATALLTDIRDDYAKTPVLTCTAMPQPNDVSTKPFHAASAGQTEIVASGPAGAGASDALAAALNIGLSLSHLHEESSLVVPFVAPAPSRIALAVEAAMAPYTRRSTDAAGAAAEPRSLAGLVNFVTWRRGARIALSRVATTPGERARSLLEGTDPPAGADVYAESVVMRGVNVDEEALRREARCVRMLTVLPFDQKKSKPVFSRLQATPEMKAYAEKVAADFESASWRALGSLDEFNETKEALHSLIDNV